MDQRPRAAGWAERLVARADPEARERPASRFPWTFLGLAAVPVGMIALGMGAFRGSEVAKWADRLPALEARARALDLPLDPSEVPKPVPAAENAAPVMKELADVALKYKPELFANSPLTVDIFQEAEKRGRILELVRAAARYDRMDFPRRWGDGAAVLFPEFAAWKPAANVMADDVRAAATEGDVARVEANLRAMDRLGNLVAQEPTLIGTLVAVAIGAITERAAQDALRLAPNAETAAAVRRYAATRTPLPDMRKGFRAETSWLALLTSSPEGYRRETRATLPDGQSAMDENVPHLPVFGAATTLDGWRAYMLSRHIDIVERLGQGRNSRERTDGMTGWDVVNHPPFVERFADLVFPIFSQAQGAILRLDASRAATEGMADAIEAGGRPTRLPPDPARPGKSFDFVPLPGGGWRLWSPGADGKGDPRDPRGDDVIASFPELEKVRSDNR